jgi:hypothetical protein
MGAGYVNNWQTTRDSKYDLMNTMRSAYTTRELMIKSKPLLGEMQAVVQDGATIEAPGREKDDRVIACALAVMAWKEWVKPMMVANGMTYARVKSEEDGTASRLSSIVNRHVADYFRRAEEQANADPRDNAPKYMLDRGLV